MLGWALTFFVIASVAGTLGFGGIAGEAEGVARVVFAAAGLLLALSLLAEALKDHAGPRRW